MQPKLKAPKKTSATILSRALELKSGHVPPAGARFILSLGIREEDKERMLELLAKQQRGKITDEEAQELETYVQADSILSVLKAKAIVALKKAGEEP
jgi:hypothetical protein